MKIEAAALAGAMERLAEVLAARRVRGADERGGALAHELGAHGRRKRPRVAGCNPAAYVESFVEPLEDDGMDEDAPRAMAAALALRAFLEGPATAVERALREAGADEPHSVRCPRVRRAKLRWRR